MGKQNTSRVSTRQKLIQGIAVSICLQLDAVEEVDRISKNIRASLVKNLRQIGYEPGTTISGSKSKFVISGDLRDPASIVVSAVRQSSKSSR